MNDQKAEPFVCGYSYDKESGRITQLGKRNAGSYCDNATDSRGYRIVQVATGSRKFRLYVKAHRLAFRLHHGRWPSAILDHVDGDTSNNRIENLREASASQSGYNRGLPSNNTSGHLGVMFNKREGRWIVVIGIGGKRIRCGVASSKMSAALAAPLIYREVAGEFARQSAHEKGTR